MIIRYGAGWFLSVFLFFILSLSAVAQADWAKFVAFALTRGMAEKIPVVSDQRVMKRILP